MAIKEQDKVFYEELANGDKVINLPITRANNVEGLGRSASTAYVVGDVVYVDNNKKVALKCTQAGTTSNSELNVGTANIGDTVTDGSVVWQVCNRTSDVTSVNGKTGDVVVGDVQDLSISGKTITVTFADGTTKTLTTQDTVYTGEVSTKLLNTNLIVGSSGFEAKPITISGLKVNVPLHIGVVVTSMSGNYTSVYVTNGTAVNATISSIGSDQFANFYDSGESQWITVVPIETSVVVTLFGKTSIFAIAAYQ